MKSTTMKNQTQLNLKIGSAPAVKTAFAAFAKEGIDPGGSCSVAAGTSLTSAVDSWRHPGGVCW